MEKRLRNRVFKTRLQENCTFWIPGKQHWPVNAKKANARIIQSYEFAQLQPSTLDLDLLKKHSKLIGRHLWVPDFNSFLEELCAYRLWKQYRDRALELAMGRQKTQLPLSGELRDPGGWRRARDTEREVDASCLALWSRARAAWCRWAPWGTATLQKPQQHRGQGAAGKVTSSTNPGSSGHGLLWKYLCVRCFIFFC